MEVNNHNFNAVREEFEKLLPSCDFYTIDEEMSGINFPGRRETAADNPDEAWALKREVASTFSILQIGVCLFHADGDGYVARPFNFFVFPEFSTQNVVLSASAIQFNKKHGMDFQKWICEGVSYVTAEGEKLLREEMFPQAPSEVRVIQLRRDEDKEWFEQASKRFCGWVDTAPGSPEFEIPTVKQVQRLYFEQEVRKQHPSFSFTWRQVANKRSYYVMRTSEEEKLAKERADLERKQVAFDRKVGFRHIFKLLVASKKPLIGHNCLYDLLFMMNAFEGALPATLAAFKAQMQQMFPCVYDTKLLAKSKAFEGRFSNTGLEPLYLDIRTNSLRMPVKLPLGFTDYRQDVLESYSRGGKAHEAAYDAYITGFVFAQLKHELGSSIHMYANQLNLMFSLYELNLAGEDKFTATGPVAYLSNITKDTQTEDLNAMLGQMEGCIQWLDDNSAFVLFGADENEDAALAQLRENQLNVRVSTYAEYRSSRMEL